MLGEPVTIQITAVSDLCCLPCYLGKASQKIAINQLREKGYNVELEYRYVPYELSSGKGLDKIGYNKRERYIQTYGEEDLLEYIEEMTSFARSYGIAWTFEGNTATTLDAHRLVHFAERIGLQDEVVEALYSAYHEQGLNIGDDEVLANVFQSVGGNRDAALAFLKSEEAVSLVRAKQQAARDRRLGGVPHYTINNQYVIVGSHGPETFLSVFEAVLTGKPAPYDENVTVL
eukprot:jgi/Hompol1/4875/HPOL_003974-RA